MSNHFTIDDDVEGLSFAARAAYATIVALTFECQDESVAVRRVVSFLGLSEQEWSDIISELYEVGVAYPLTDGNIRLVQLNDYLKILSASLGVPGRPHPKDWAELRSETFRQYGERCVYCGNQDGPFAVDHINPIAKGGSNHRCNLVVACRACNSSKGSKAYQEWMVSQ